MDLKIDICIRENTEAVYDKNKISNYRRLTMRDYLYEIKELEKENVSIKKQLIALDDHINDLYKRFGNDIFVYSEYEILNNEQRDYWYCSKRWNTLNGIMKRNNDTIERMRAEYQKLHDDAYLSTSLIDICKKIQVNDCITGIKF